VLSLYIGQPSFASVPSLHNKQASALYWPSIVVSAIAWY
jgi:hypothetical protein